ncbi:MAG: CAP domain-containing protein [Nannocystaceae bacterium]
MSSMFWRSAIAVGLLVGTGCPSNPGSGASARRHAQPPSRADLEGIDHADLQIRLSAPAVERYGAPVEHSLTAVEQSIAAGLAAQPMTLSPALSRMVRELAATTPDKLNVPPALVDGLMAWSGLVDPPPRLTVVEMPDDRLGCDRSVIPQCEPMVRSLVAEVATTLPSSDDVIFGVGVTRLPDGRTRMIVAVLEPAVRLRPMPAVVRAGGSFTVAGQLVGPRRAPVVEVVGPGGRWQRLPTSVSVDGGFEARLPCEDGPGAYQVEVLADGTHGIEVAANFPVYCGARPPETIAVVVETVDDAVTADQIARANFLYLNEERRSRGLAELEWDAQAAAVAWGHSRDMHDNGFVGHVSPTTGDVTARLQRAGVSGAMIRENVARGYGPQGIHASLLASPGHRANMLARDVTHVGIGAVVGKPETDMDGAPRPVFVTQNFYKKPGAGAPTGDLAAGMRALVDARRSDQGLAAVRWSEGLAAIAQDYAEAVGRGRPPPRGYDQEAFALGYSSVQVQRVSSIDFDALATAELWSMTQVEAGIGMVRTKERGGGQTFLLVVLVGERG